MGRGGTVHADKPAWARRVGDSRVVSGILHILCTGGRWREVPAEYGPATTVYDRFNRWSRRGLWRAMLGTLAEAGWIAQTAAIDSTYTTAHRCVHGGKGGAIRKDFRRVATRYDKLARICAATAALAAVVAFWC